MQTLALSSGRVQARVTLQGAAILQADVDRAPLLAPARGAGDPTRASCYPMVPWCDRLSAGGVAAADGHHPIDANWDSTPFPVHGYGWQAV